LRPHGATQDHRHRNSRGAVTYWLPLLGERAGVRGRSHQQPPLESNASPRQAIASERAAAPPTTGSLSHRERAGVRGRSHQQPPRESNASPRQTTASKSAVATPTTGSLSHRERAGVRGRLIKDGRPPRKETTRGIRAPEAHGDAHPSPQPSPPGKRARNNPPATQPRVRKAHLCQPVATGRTFFAAAQGGKPIRRPSARCPRSTPASQRAPVPLRPSSFSANPSRSVIAP